MYFRRLSIILIIGLFLGGCVSNPHYGIDTVEQQFSERIKNVTSMAVIKFDASIPSNAINVGTSFGAIGLSVASAGTVNTEVLSINLQNETMSQLQEVISKAKTEIKYKPIDLMEGTDIEEVNKRFKSNVMWGFSALKEEEIKDFFLKNPNVDFGIHITSSALEPFYTKLVLNTKWTIYEKNGKSVAKINTRSVKEVPTREISEEDYFNEMKGLQYKNINEFIRLMGTV